MRIWSASNLGGVGHQFVKDRFVTTTHPDREFIPARLEDNPHVDRVEYLRALEQLDPISKARLRNGNWDVSEGMGMFHHEDFNLIDVDRVPEKLQRVRFWDLVSTEVKSGRDPDFTAGVLMGAAEGRFYILDLQHTP